MNKFVPILRKIPGVIPGVLHGLKNGNGAGGGVITHAVGDAAVFGRVVGEDDGYFAIFFFRVTEGNPVRCETRHIVHPVCCFLVGHDSALGGFVVVAVTLEGNGAGMNAAIEFRQHYIHGEVAASQALLAGPPAFLRDAAENNLQDRTVINGERIAVATR